MFELFATAALAFLAGWLFMAVVVRWLELVCQRAPKWWRHWRD